MKTVGGVVAASSLNFSVSRPASAQSTMSPDDALQTLMDGNHRYVSGQLKSFEEDVAILRQKTAEKQEPFAAVLSCADSRVPVELVFDQSVGHVFITRIAGNIVTPEIIASLEYGAAVLGTRVILVMGHGNCGAVKATIEGKEVPGMISALYLGIRAAVNEAGSDLEAATRTNAKIQADLLRQGSTVISGLMKDKKIRIVPAFYDVNNGSVTILE
jgi:carbonic anhydrase